jgi:hypothetical protein
MLQNLGGLGADDEAAHHQARQNRPHQDLDPQHPWKGDQPNDQEIDQLQRRRRSRAHHVPQPGPGSVA